MVLSALNTIKYTCFLVCFLTLSLSVSGQDQNAGNKNKSPDNPLQPPNERRDNDPENLTDPVLALKSAKYNFGNVNKGTKVKHAFLFKNAGEKPLKITEINKSCDCIEVEYPEKALKSGSVHKIKVYLDTETLKGRQNHFIEVLNNGQRKKIKLDIKGNVKQ